MKQKIALLLAIAIVVFGLSGCYMHPHRPHHSPHYRHHMKHRPPAHYQHFDHPRPPHHKRMDQRWHYYR